MRPDLEALLAERLAACREAWPDLVIERSAFLAFVAQRCADGALPAAERIPDLYLACGCALGHKTAVVAFDRAFRPLVGQVIARMDRSPAFADDVFQHMCERLLVGSGEGAGKITEYAGRASLRAWLTTIAKRTALNLRRRKDDQPAETDRSGVIEAGMAALGAREGPETGLLKARFKGIFEGAIRAALDGMSAADRTLLVLNLVDGVTVRQLAAMQGATKSTMARRIASAREALAEATRRELRGQAKLTESEYESVVALLQSQLEVSVAAVVRGMP
jgi:RNA polymerase sigma-70 factor, ECF subfamily